jgi:3-oxoacyl-[acyl-carrier protein] reductase
VNVGDDRRNALVAGATTPVGTAIAKRLAEDGLNVTPGRGPLDVAVFASVEPHALTSRPLVEVDEDAFARDCEEPMRDFLRWLQDIHPLVRDRCGTVVLVAPTVSQEGATGLVPYSTAVEGQRLLAKSAARQWASDGIAVLIVAPRLDVVAGGTSNIEPSDAGRTQPVLDAASYDASAVARVVSMLVATADGGHALSGSTIAVDGGALMAP